jgi:predicted nuclease of predicted toxin-antitoxin system
VRLLFDQNLARSLIGRLVDVFPGSEHVTGCGLDQASDREVWDHARVHGLAIVTKDSDFNQLSFLHGMPPRVIWLRLGNCTTNEIEQILRLRAADIAAFEADPEAAILVVDRA